MSLVQLHVYDVTAQHASAIKSFNTFGREVGMGGIFHGGVEVGLCVHHRVGIVPYSGLKLCS